MTTLSGLDSLTRSWTRRAVCTPGTHDYFSKGPAVKAAHICLSHCPVLAECSEWADFLIETETVAKHSGVILAGRVYTDDGTQSADNILIGCGKHCAGLPRVPASQPTRHTLPSADLRHGQYAGYQAGCRCDPCREALRQARRRQRQAAAERRDNPHAGLSTYQMARSRYVSAKTCQRVDVALRKLGATCTPSQAAAGRLRLAYPDLSLAALAEKGGLTKDALSRRIARLLEKAEKPGRAG